MKLPSGLMIAIVGLVVAVVTAGILFPSFSHVQVPPISKATLSHANQLAMVMTMYLNDYDNVLPAAQSTDELRRALSMSGKYPADWKDDNPRGGRSLFATNLAGLSVTTPEDHANTPLFYESKPWPDEFRLVVFLEGPARKVSQHDWPLIEARLKRDYHRLVH